jgi:hypothetical protein
MMHKNMIQINFERKIEENEFRPNLIGYSISAVKTNNSG